jgi:outer membrane protein OmpA-like peptidoglycan-associated protein
LALLTLLNPEGRSQFWKKKESKKIALSSDSVLIDISPIVFTNINQLPAYINKKEEKKIQKLDQAGDWKALYPVLKDYVSKFGPANFAHQTYYIWRLAKLTEIFGSAEEAKPLYAMVLKHHRRGIDIGQVLARYDSLDKNKKEYFVPLDYYYELVEFRRQVDTLIPPKSVLQSMGPKVNSNEEDYGPMVTQSDSVLLFTSKRNSTNDGLNRIEKEDLFITRLVNNSWAQAELLAPTSSEYKEGSGFMTQDGKTIYFTRCGAPDGMGNCDLYVTEYFEGEETYDSTYVVRKLNKKPNDIEYQTVKTKRDTAYWKPARNLGDKINSSTWDSHPTLNATEDTLYFASDRVGGFGMSDIYFITKDKNNEWTSPKNLGPIVNTRANELSPFYHPLFEVLYFSSNGHLLNFGDYDIYKSYHIGSGNNWSEPYNIGPLVNGEGTEFYFSIDRQSEYIYYARSEEQSMKGLNLYSFPLPMEGQPLANTRFSGNIKDVYGKIPEDLVVSIIDLDEGVEVAPKYAREDGTFEFDLINERNYLLVIQGDDVFRLEEFFFLDGEQTFEGVVERISSKIQFKSIKFENGKAEILPNMHQDLQKVIDFLIDHPSFSMVISGHTDSSGDRILNLKLSQQRADAIRDYILNSTIVISSQRVQAIGYGSSKPLIKEEKTSQDRQTNRRVEFEIYRDPNNG